MLFWGCFLNAFAKMSMKMQSGWVLFYWKSTFPGWFYRVLNCLWIIQVTWKISSSWDYAEGIIGIYIGYKWQLEGSIWKHYQLLVFKIHYFYVGGKDCIADWVPYFSSGWLARQKDKQVNKNGSISWLNLGFCGTCTI